MNTSKFRFTLDLQKTQSQISIPVTLGDTGRTWLISFSDGGQPYEIEEGSLAKLEIKRPTGTYMEEFCAIENGTTVSYSFSQNENTAVDEGINQCAVILYGEDEEIVASPRFTMIVTDRVVSSDDINLSDEDKSIIDAIVKREASRNSDEKKRVNAEASRVEAETARVTEENIRQESEKARNAAEASRVAVEQKRVEADQKRAKKFAELEVVKANPDGVAPLLLSKVKIGNYVYSTGNAYALAKANGYDGTEEAFGKKLADLMALEVYEGDSIDIYSGESEDIK